MKSETVHQDSASLSASVAKLRLGTRKGDRGARKTTSLRGQKMRAMIHLASVALLVAACGTTPGDRTQRSAWRRCRRRNRFPFRQHRLGAVIGGIAGAGVGAVSDPCA